MSDHPIDIFPWNDHFDTGLSEVDEQHRKLVQLLNLLADHIASGGDAGQLDRIFDELAGYAVHHFATEEAIWQRDLGDEPEALDHRDAHRSFVREVQRLRASLQSKPGSDVAEEALGFLARWLAAHILESDRHLAYVVLARRGGLSPEAARLASLERMAGQTRALVGVVVSTYSTLCTHTLRLMHELEAHRRDKTALAESEKLLHEAVDNISAGFTIFDPQDRLVVCNETYRNLYATSRDLIVPGARFEDIVRQGAERGQYKDAAGNIDAWVRQRVACHREATGQPIEQALDDGRWLMIIEHRTPSGHVVGNRIDITSIKKAEEGLRLAKAESERLLDESVEREFFWRESQQVGQIGGWRADPVNNTVMWTEGVHPIIEMPADYQPDLQSGLDSFLPESRARVVDHLQRTLTTGEPFCIQVQVRGEKTGVAKWAELRGHPHRDAEGRIDYLMGTLQDFSERRRIASELQSSSSFNASLIHTMLDGVAVCHGIGEPPFVRFTVWNPAMVKLTGYDIDDINRLGWYQTVYVDPEVQEKARLRMERMREGDNLDHEEWVITRKGGERRTVEITTTVLASPDGSTHVMAVMHDITEKKRVDDALRVSEERFDLAMRAANDGLWDWNLQTQGVYFSPRWKAMLGYADDELANAFPVWEALTDDAGRARTMAMIGQCLSGMSDGFVSEFRMQHKDGHWVDILSRAIVVRGDGDRPLRMVGTHVDISERKRVEQALNEAQHLAGIGSWELRLADNRLVWSDEIYRIFEIDPTRFGASYEAFLASVHPDDREAVDSAYVRSLRTREPYAIRHRLRMADGRIKHVHEQCRTDFDENGAPLRSVGTVQDVTEQVRAEQALQDSRNLLRLVIDHVPLRVFWKDRALNYLGCNPAFARDAGMQSPGELIGKDDYQMAWAADADRYRADDREVIASGSARIDLEEPMTTPDGRTNWLRTSKVPLRNLDDEIIGVLGIYQDITQERARDEELRQHRDHLEALVAKRTAELAQNQFALDRAGIAIAWHDTETGRFLYVNDEACRRLGYRRDELLQLAAGDVNPQLPTETVRRIAAEMRESQSVLNIESTLRRKDGSTFPVESAVYLTRMAERGECFIAFTRDITERKSAERKLREAKEAAESANVAKSAFLANMSHEIRTPLNGILGMAHLIRRAGLNDQQARRMDNLEASSKHLLNVINAILDLSKIEAGRFALEKTAVRIESLMIATASMLQERVQAKHLTLRTEIGALPPHLIGDPTRLQQALLNYAGNAVKFTETGSITLRTRLVDEDASSALIRFEVQDTGIGIPPEAMPRLFSAFEQADTSLARRHGGTGLGLAITRKIAQLMGGDAGAHSILGAGSTFWFSVRLDKGADDTAGSNAGEPSSAEDILERDHKGARILLVEDEPINQEIAQLMLGDAGLAVDVAKDGPAALEMAAANDYALILMDLQLPTMDGLTATRRIRLLPRHPRTPILALTANAFADDRRSCLDAGMNDFIAKPVIPDVLFRTVLTWLDKGRGP